MAQNFLFGNLPALKASRESDQDILKKSQARAGTKTRVARGATGGTKYANKVSLAEEQAKTILKDDGSILLARDEKDFFDYIKDMKKIKRGACDTETSGLDPISDFLVGLCLYAPGLPAIYVPSKHCDFYDNLRPNQVPYEILREGLQQIIDIPLDYHNGKFDLRFIFNSLGIWLPIGWDTSLGGNFLNENEPHQLKPLWDKYVSKSDEKSAKFGDLFGGIPFQYVRPEIGYLYAGKDPRMTFELAEFQRQFLDPSSDKCQERDLVQTGKLLINVETPLIPIIARMEDTGIEIDADKGTELANKYGAMIEDAEKEALSLIADLDFSKLTLEQRSKLGNPINLNSPPQLGILFYDVMKLKNNAYKDPRGTGKELIEGFIESYPQYAKLFGAILEYKRLGKLLSTYILKLPKIVKEKTGRLHGSFNQYGAKTGRFSSSDPNLQNIPSKNKEIRKMFRAAMNKVLISTDYSQQEPRVLAHLCFLLFRDRGMMEAYLAGKDLYAWMASEIYGYHYDECKEKLPDGTNNPDGKKRRDSVKSILLGLMYGRQVKSIGEQLGVNEAEAQKIVDMVFEAFPAIKQVVDYYLDMARKKGFVVTVFGRKRRLPDMQLPEYEFVYADNKDEYIEDEQIIQYYWSKIKNVKWAKDRRRIFEEANSRGIWIVDNTSKIAEAERQCLNSVIQGTSADITKMAMLVIGTDEQLKEWGYQLLLSIHDEVIGEAPEETARRCADRVCELMIEVCKEGISVPMKVDPEITRIWYGEDITDELVA